MPFRLIVIANFDDNRIGHYDFYQYNNDREYEPENFSLCFGHKLLCVQDLRISVRSLLALEQLNHLSPQRITDEEIAFGVAVPVVAVAFVG